MSVLEWIIYPIIAVIVIGLLIKWVFFDKRKPKKNEKDINEE